ncbi:putative phloem protein [Helianthus annuus]|nr:putative phloem protein [Helianthus annuus]
MQPISDSDANWEEKLPTDYKDIIKRSKNSVQWTTKEEAYSMMCRGFLIDDGEKWFSLDKNGKKCHMLSAVFVWHMTGDKHLPLSESRFGEVFQLDSSYFYTHINIQSQLVSSQTTYASYLVYKLPDDQSGFDGPIEVKADDADNLSHNEWYIYLVGPQTPIIRPKADENTHNPVHMPKLKGLPQQRNDGWMEVQLWEFQSATSNNLDRPEKIGFSQQINDGWMGVQFQELPSGTTNFNKYPLLIFTKCDHKSLKGLIIAGVEYRPV